MYKESLFKNTFFGNMNLAAPPPAVSKVATTSTIKKGDRSFAFGGSSTPEMSIKEKGFPYFTPKAYL